MRKLVLVAAMLLIASPAHAFFGFFDSAEQVKDKDGVISIDTSAIAKGSAKHYRFASGKKEIRFFVVRDDMGVLRAAYDVCDVCWRENKGYKLDRGTMLCINCGQRFALGRIGIVTGGCNPHPMPYNLESETLTTTASELVAEGSRYFPEK